MAAAEAVASTAGFLRPGVILPPTKKYIKKMKTGLGDAGEVVTEKKRPKR